MTVDRHTSLAFALMVSIALALTVTSAFAASPVANSKTLADTGKRPTDKASIPVDRQLEAKANRLVQAHLPELKDVLRRLRAGEPREYGRAIRDLAKSARKLELAESRNDGLYDIEVELLQAQTEVNLTTARLKVRDNEPDRKRLRNAASRLQKAQLARAQHDVEMLRGRLEKAQQQLEAARKRLAAKQEDPNQQLEKTYLSLLRKAGRQPNRARSEQTRSEQTRSDPASRGSAKKQRVTSNPKSRDSQNP